MDGSRITLTVKEVSQATGVPVSTLYALAQAGRLPCCRVGRRVLIPVAALREMLSGQRPEGGRGA